MRLSFRNPSIDIRTKTRTGGTLMSIIAAVTISATITVATLMALQRPTADSGNHACEATRQSVQAMVDQFFDENGRYPRANLQELVDQDYWTGPIPTCPATDRTLRLRRGVVDCPIH